VANSPLTQADYKAITEIVVAMEMDLYFPLLRLEFPDPEEAFQKAFTQKAGGMSRDGKMILGLLMRKMLDIYTATAFAISEMIDENDAIESGSNGRC